MTQIIWSPRALRDLETIRDYISQDSPRVAALVVARIVKAVERLEPYPESGRKVPERNDPEIREVIAAHGVVPLGIKPEEDDLLKGKPGLELIKLLRNDF